VKVEYKKKSTEDGFIPPNGFDKSFEELGIVSGAQLVIIEMRGVPDSVDMDSEGQEDEFEEMEEELDEGELGEEDAEEANKEEDGNQNSQKVDPDSKILDTTNVNQALLSSVIGPGNEEAPNASSATPAAPE
jgi:hypothetical protein